MKEIFVICNTKGCVNASPSFHQIIKWDGISSIQLARLKECPQCGLPRLVVKDVFKEETKKLEKDFSSIGVGRIAGMSPIERKQLLKKRSTEHYKKEIEPRKKWMDSEVYKPFKK